MQFDLWSLYQQMLYSRRFEEAVSKLWHEGKISGEMHLNMGEEAIMAGMVSQLKEGDAMALDHRGTSPLLLRGVDPVLLLREFLEHPQGLCSGMGGHMHLFSPEYLAASSGIVGACGPGAVGFALAAKHLRPDTLAVAFFGEGTMNQGMLMESMNLAVAWNLPVLFVCKDSQWAITTVSESVTGGKLVERAQSFGMPAREIDGTDVETVWHTAHEAMEHVRKKKEPFYIHAHCVHSEGHFLGDPLLRIARHPVKEMKEVAGSLIKSATRTKGASISKRTGSLGTVTAVIGKAAKGQLDRQKDPVLRTRKKLKSDKSRLLKLEKKVEQKINTVLTTVLISRQGAKIAKKKDVT